ncbi:MAG: hypothetical protein K2N41_00090 [Lachnospiraceae bacterium]|nr:hypothetical protein [Lachnospiraceae bacterium]
MNAERGISRMKKRKEIAGFRKGRALNYSTSVTATKGEQATIWLCALLVMCVVLAALFVFKSILALFLSVFGGILLLFGVMLFCVFRSKHREERLQNTVTSNGKVDEAWNNLPGKDQRSDQW